MRAFAGAGARVLAVDLQDELGHALAEELGPAVAYQRADVSRESEVAAAVDRCVAQWGRLDTSTGSTGGPPLPVLPAGNPMALTGVAVRVDAQILVDGQPVAGSISCTGGAFSPLYCSSNRISVQLAATPANGLRMLQLQNTAGPLSNELPLCVGPVSGCR